MKQQSEEISWQEALRWTKLTVQIAQQMKPWLFLVKIATKLISRFELGEI